MKPQRILITGGCGYIGSALFRYLTERGHACCSVDNVKRGNPGRIQPNIHIDFTMMVPEHFAPHGFDVLVHLAAMATVQECEKDPCGAFYDNLVYPVSMVTRCLKQGQQLIYASTGSVHSRNGLVTAYDYTKRSLEQAMRIFYPSAVGLRFGTVCGPSPNIRGTMLNAMVESGMRDGVVRANNLTARRPILGINDLCRAIEAQIDHPMPGVHDLCSFNTVVDEARLAVAGELGVETRIGPNSPTYDFAMPCAEWFRPRETLGSIINDLREFYARDPAAELEIA